MDGAAIIEQLMTTEVRTDPYPLYARAHELGPVLPAGDGMFVVSGYAAVNKVLRTSAFGVATADMMAGLAPEFGEHSSLALFGRSILQRNAPDQPRVRSLIASVFTARRVAALRPAVEAAVGRLLDGMAEQGADGSPVDFMDAFAFRLEHGGRSLVYSGDTGESPALVELARDTDLFLCEAAYLDGRDTYQAVHLNGREAGEHATAAGARRLVLTHIPPWTDAERNRRDAAATYAGPVELARAGAVYEV